MYAEGIDVPGYHLHYISDDREAGGHVLDCALAQGELALDHSSELHLELPQGVELGAPGAGAGARRLLDRIEREPPA